MADWQTLSDRINNVAPSATLAVDSKAKAMKAAGVDVIGFGAGEPNFPTPDYVVEAAAEACRAGKVTVNGRDAKPAHTLKVGDEVELFFAAGSLKFRVLELKESVKKEDAAKMYEILGDGQ